MEDTENKSATTDRESYIVQNITLGHHFVSDIKLQFGPREVIDLTWEDPVLIKKSKNLKDSINKGILKKLTDEEYEKTKALQYNREQKELLKQQQAQPKYKNINADGKTLIADTFDAAKSRKKTEAPVDNHILSYVTAFEIAQGLEAEKGNDLTAEEFAEAVENNPEIVNQLLAHTKGSQKQAHIATFAVPPGEFGQGSGVTKAEMTNWHRDHKYAGADFNISDSNIRDAVDFNEDSDFTENPEDIDFGEEIVIDSEE
jgi:hypothetical protein